MTAFSHRSADRVLLDYCATEEVDVALREHLGVSDREAMLRRLHVDFRHLDKWGVMLPEYVGPELRDLGDGVTEDIWGCRIKKMQYNPGCFYYEWVAPPLADATTVADVERHRWPDPDWYDFTPVAEYCRSNDEHCLVAGRGATFDSVGFFRGMEQAMLDVYDNPGVLEAIVEKIFEFQCEYNRRVLAAAGGRLDILFFSEDMGGQNGLLVSVETLRKYVVPKLRTYAELAHSHGALAMLHSDGAIGQIIPDLIDVGVDIIDPVQHNLPGMDAADLKRQYGERLCFHGLLDSQELMPFGTPETVAAEVRRLVDVVGADGGLALSPSCGFQVDVPMENILAAYDTSCTN